MVKKDLAAGKWLLLAFGSAYSVNSFWLLSLLAFSSIPRCISQIYIRVLRAQDKLKKLLSFRSFITVSVLILSFFLMPDYGILSIGYVWLLIQVVVCIAVAPRLIAAAR